MIFHPVKKAIMIGKARYALKNVAALGLLPIGKSAI